MKGKVSIGLVFTVTLAVVLAAPAFAKSPSDRLSVEGPGLITPVEITDSVDLSKFSPWGREFIDWDRGLVTAPPADQSYTVSFFLGGRKIYVVKYVPAPSGGSSYIYIPGLRDSEYPLNVGTIVGASSSDRWDPEGKWQYATAEWDAVIQRAIRANGPIPTVPPSTTHLAPSSVDRDTADATTATVLMLPPATPPLPSWPVAALAVGLTGGLALLIWRHRPHPAD